MEYAITASSGIDLDQLRDLFEAFSHFVRGRFRFQRILERRVEHAGVGLINTDLRLKRHLGTGVPPLGRSREWSARR